MLIFTTVKNWLTQSELRIQLTKGSVVSLILQVLFAGLAFVTASILGNILGADGYGVYANAQAWVSVLSSAAVFGFDSLLIRNISIYSYKELWNKLKGIMNFSKWLSLSLSLILAIGLDITILIFTTQEEIVARNTIWIASILIPIYSLSTLRQSAIRGLGHVTRALVSELTIRPVILLASILILLLTTEKQLTTQNIMWVNVAAAIIALFFATNWLNHLLPKNVHSQKSEYCVHEWIIAAAPLMIVNLLNLVYSQTSIIILGIIDNSIAVGLYSAAFRISYLISYFPIAMGVVITPIIARLYANDETDRLQKILKFSTRISFTACLILAFVLCFSGEFLLSLFGPEFIYARWALYILVFGNLVDAACGPSIGLLTMTHYQKPVALAFCVFSIINIFLNWVFINYHSFTGSAIASTCIMVFSRIFFLSYAEKKTGINPSIIKFYWQK